MKKILIIFAIFIIILFVYTKSTKTFYLNEKYYNDNLFLEIKLDELKELESKKESFIIYIYQPMCQTSTDFENILKAFMDEQNISLYKISCSEIKNTRINDLIMYYPTVAIYQKGNIAAYLQANKNSDKKYFGSLTELQKWITQYVKLKK